MNRERIQELAEQCWINDGGPDSYFSQQKFAELIVRECAEFIDSKLEMTKYSGEVVSWADGDDLKEHFGVES